MKQETIIVGVPSEATMRALTMHALYKAARHGDLAEMQQLVGAGADLNAYDENEGRTPLMAACLSARAGIDAVEFLLAHGADIHAISRAKFEENKPLIALAISNPATSLEKIRLLIERGADVHYRSAHGYTLLTWAACSGREDVVDVLLASGTPVDGKSNYGESALSVLSRQGLFNAIAKVLNHGADPAPLGWTPLHQAIALGRLPDVEDMIDAGADLEATDRWERTPFLLAIQAGDTDKATLLLARGANRAATGRCGKPPTHYPIDRDDAPMLQWLIGQGFDLNQEDEHGDSALVAAADDSAPRCFRLLMEAGAEWEAYAEELVSNASNKEIIAMLQDREVNLASLEDDVMRRFIGLRTTDELEVTEEEYLEGRFRKFGNANPERMQVPFWNAMVRCGWDAYQATDRFGDDSFGRDNPVWCHRRLDMSLTRLPDGRFVQIAGEHEDGYDPDFCIYNEVFIHDGKGGFEILGYPENEFPPTDFHSATLVGPWIYIIGNLGYRHTQEAHHFQTPVYRLHTETWRIERVATQGRSPGWIHGHRAQLKDACIQVSGGKVLRIEATGKTKISDHTARFALNLETHEWRPIADYDS